MAFTARSTSLTPVRMMTGISIPPSRICLRMSRPLNPGMSMSRIIRSYPPPASIAGTLFESFDTTGSNSSVCMRKTVR